MTNPAVEHDHAFLRDGGETGKLIGNLDWAATAVGPIASWPDGMKSVVSMLLRSVIASFPRSFGSV